MPASKAEQVLNALKALLETVPDAAVPRNSVLPEKIPDSGLIAVRDGNPGEPERALSGSGNAYYQHAVEIEVYVEEGDAAARDAAIDALLPQIGTAREAEDPPAHMARHPGWRNFAPLARAPALASACPQRLTC